jgi:putative selenate reductase molybdopterin-binding subunit
MFKVVGKSINKVDGLSHATGKSEFADDFHLKGMLHGKILKSPCAHGKIKNIDTSKATALEGVKAVLTFKDLPRIPHTTAGQGYPEPSPYDTFILDNKVRHIGDRVAVVAAITPEIAEKALSLIDVEYEFLPAVFVPGEALKEGAPVIHDEPEAHMPIPLPYYPKKNIASEVDVKIGDVEQGLKEADYILEKVYYSHRNQHCSTEPHATITYLDEKNRLIIRTSTQVPFHVRRIVAMCLEIPVKRIRVIKPRIGGGFGGKQEILLETLCSALTLKTGKPVRIVYTREEEFTGARSRHPQYNYLKTGVKKDGKITAIDMNIINDTGAYGSHALTVMCNGGNKALPLYKCDNVNFRGKAVYTNNIVSGAFRGYGAPQTQFAMEVQMDEMAEAIGMDPLEFRKKNHIKLGETSPVFKALGEGKAGTEQYIESCGLEKCIELGAKEIGWEEKRKNHNTDKLHIKRGVGMATLLQGSGIPEIDMGSATMKMNDDGSFNLLVGATDLGTGSDTILSQIAAEVLGVSSDDIIIYSSDTDMTPFDVGAYASSTTYISGNAVKKAAEGVKKQIFEVASKILKEDISKLICDNGIIKSKSGKELTYKDIALKTLYGSEQFQIGYTASNVSNISPPPFAAHFAEVEVDIETGFVKVVKYVTAVDCGTPINPKLAEGQIIGGTLMGISFALTEEYKFSHGRVLNPGLGEYKIFTMKDLPEIVPIIVETYDPTGPFGAKSVAEIAVCGELPAISNAIYNATGIRLYESPFTPEKVLNKLKIQ